jgi:phosphonate transport system substrate-binding protein
VTVEFVPVADYPAAVSALAARQVDLAWYGGFTHVQARRATGGTAVPLVMRDRDAQFKSVFITRADSGIKNLEDLRGRTFAFGSESSTSGHLMPRHFLGSVTLGRTSYTGAHDATVLWVSEGRVDAGALNVAVWERMVREKRVDPERVTVFWTTPPYVDYNWTVRGDLDAEFGAGFTERLRKAFLDLSDPAILDLQSAGKYIAAKPEDFAGIEQAARDAGLIRD